MKTRAISRIALRTQFREPLLCGPGADQLRERYPGLIYARGNGFGSRGPDANQAGYDASAFFARRGVADALTPTDRDYPIHQRGAMGDRNGGMAVAFGIAGALLKKTAHWERRVHSGCFANGRTQEGGIIP